MIPEEDFQTWSLIITTVSDDIPSFNTMLPDLKRMMDSVEKTNFLPGELNIFTDDFINDTFPNLFNSILETTKSMIIKEDNINDVENISDFFKSSIKLCISILNCNSIDQSTSIDDSKKIYTKNIKFVQMVIKLFDKIDLKPNKNENEKVLNQSFLFYFLDDLNAIDKCNQQIDNINRNIDINDEIIEKQALLVSVLFKLASKVIYETTFEAKTQINNNINKIDFEKEKINLYHYQISSLLSKTFTAFKLIAEKNWRKFDATLLDPLFDTLTKSIQIDFALSKNDDFPLIVNLLEPSYFEVLSTCLNCSFFDKVLYSLKTISLLCRKATDFYKNNNDYFESDDENRRKKKLKLNSFFIDKNVLFMLIIDNLNQIQNIQFNKEFGEPLGTIYAFIIEHQENVIKIDFLKQLWKNNQFVFAADRSSFYKIFEKITKVMNGKDCEELFDFVLKSITEETNENSLYNTEILDFFYTIALNFQKNKLNVPFMKIRDLFWSISFGEQCNEVKEFARKKINSLCHFCSNEIIERLINDKFQNVKDVPKGDEKNSPVEKENEFILKMCENSINKDEEVIRPDLCSTIINFCISHLKNKNAISLLTKVCTTQKVSLEKEQIEQLSNTSNKFLTNILFSSGFDDDYIENLLLSLSNIDSDLFELIEKYVISKNPQWEAIENDYLTYLPFEKENLLWTFSMKQSKVQKQFMNKLCEIYSNNDGFLLTDEQMIKHFLNRIDKEIDENENKENVFQLLHRFIQVVDETYPYLNDVRRHKASNEDKIFVSFQGIKDNFTYSKQNSVLVAYYQASKSLNVPINQVTLIYDDRPAQMTETFSKLTYIRNYIELIPIIGDPSTSKIRHLRKISPTFQIARTNLMNKLISSLKDEKKGDKKNSYVLMDLMNDLPTSTSIYSIINSFDKMNEINFESIFPTDHSRFFIYSLQTLQSMNENIIKEFIRKKGIEYFIEAMTKIDSLFLISDIMEFLKSTLNTDELIEKHSNQLFEVLMRICMCVSDNHQAKFLSFMKKLKVTNIPEFDFEFSLKFVEPEINEEKEKKDKEIDDYINFRKKYTERFRSPLFDDLMDPIFDDDFMMRHEYLRNRRMRLFGRDPFSFKKEDETVNIDVEMPFSHVITNVIAMTLIKKNVYVNETKEIKKGEPPSYLKSCAIETLGKLPINSEYFEASFPYLAPSNYKDFMKAYSPHIKPPTKTVIKFIQENLDTRSKYLPFIMEVLTLIINEISEDETRNMIFKFIFENIFILNRDASIEDDVFKNAMIVVSNASPESLLNKINNLNVPDFDQYQINGKDYKQDKSKTGLKNLGATCYLNSILQQFYHLPMFRKIIIEYNGNDQLFKELGILFSQMREGTLKFVSPKSVADNWICWDGQKIDPKIQQDASEFICMLLDKFESIIPFSMFNGKLSSTIEGINKDEGLYKKETNEPFSLLCLPINQSNSLTDCLTAFCLPSFYTNDNQYYADTLKRKIDAKQSDFIEEAPDHLIVELKRFEIDYATYQRKKINSKVSISREIDIESICKFKNNIRQSTKYNLAGVIQHMGSAYGGHYFSYVMERDTQMWYKCNDIEVSLVTLDDVIENANGNDSNAYILFYDRCDINESDDSIVNQSISQQLEVEQLKSSNYHFYMTNGFIEFLNQISKRKELQEIALKLIIKVLPHASVETSKEFFDSLKERFESDESFATLMQNEITDLRYLILNEITATNNLITDKLLIPMSSHSISKRLIQLAIETFDFAFERIPNSAYFFKVLYGIVNSAMKQKENKEIKELLNIICDKTTYIMKSGIKEYVSAQKDLSANYVMKSINMSVIARLYNIYETIPNDYIELMKDFEFLRSLYSSKNSDVTYFMSNYVRARELGLFDVNLMLKEFFDKESINLKMEPLFQSLLMIFKEDAFPLTRILKFKLNDNFRTPQDIALCYTLLCKNGIEKDLLISNFDKWVPNLLMNDGYEARKMGLAPFRYLIPHTLFKKSFGEIPKYNDSYIYTSEFFNSVELQSKTTPEMKITSYKLIQCLINSLKQLKVLIRKDDFSSKFSFPIERYKGFQLLKLLNVCIKIFNDGDEIENTNYSIDYSKVIEFGEFLLTNGYSHPFDPHIVYILKILRNNCTDQLLIDSIPQERVLKSSEIISKISSSQLTQYMRIFSKIISIRLTNDQVFTENFYEKMFKNILFNLRCLTPIVKTWKFIDSYNLIIKSICNNEDASERFTKFIDNDTKTCLIEGFHSCITGFIQLKKKRSIAKYIHSYNISQIFSEVDVFLPLIYYDTIIINTSENSNETNTDEICYDTLFDDISVAFWCLCQRRKEEKEDCDYRSVIWDYLINNTRKRIKECPEEDRLNLQKKLFKQFSDNYNLYYFNFFIDSTKQRAELKNITQFVLLFVQNKESNENKSFEQVIIDHLIFLAKNSFDAMYEVFDVLKDKVPEQLKDNNFITDVLSNDIIISINSEQNFEFFNKFREFAFEGKTKEEISSIFKQSRIEYSLNDKTNIILKENISE